MKGKHKKDWKVGDKLEVIENGEKITGEVVKINKNGYRILWSDGETTVEDEPSPAIKKETL